MRPDALLVGTARFVDSVLAHEVQVVVADALLPYLPSLLAMGLCEGQIDGFMIELDRILAPVRTVLVFLDGDPAVALSRAAARERPDWLEWYVAKLARYGVAPPVRDVASAIEYLRRERAATLRAAHRQGWPVALIERATERDPADVLGAAQHLLRPWLPLRT